MVIIISINEENPGELHSLIHGKGTATQLEKKLVKHLALFISKGLAEFDKMPGIIGSGEGLTIIQRD